MAGTTSFCRQALASGHLDMMWASRATFVAFFAANTISVFSVFWYEAEAVHIMDQAVSVTQSA